ncbi:MAG TPA: hypothetical protein VN713_06510 [Sphingomicrobium sp.]|nr:hypothetical protein [Sphingomicrobium sp.]
MSGLSPSFAILIGSLVIYFTALVLFLAKGWPVRGGLAMTLAAVGPILWQIRFTDSDMPGFALLLALTLPPALLITIIGCLLSLMRLGRRLSTSRPATMDR